MSRIKSMINTIQSAKEMISSSCNDEYNVGMYNGMEYALSVLEGRKPEYFVLTNEEEKTEQETKQRTVVTGVKRR